jgi:hypothetical protein
VHIGNGQERGMGCMSLDDFGTTILAAFIPFQHRSADSAGAVVVESP